MPSNLKSSPRITVIRRPRRDPAKCKHWKTVHDTDPATLEIFPEGTWTCLDCGEEGP